MSQQLKGRFIWLPNCPPTPITDRQYCLTIYTTQSPLRALLTEMWALLAPCSLTNNSYMTT